MTNEQALRQALEHCLNWLPEDCAAACEAREALAAPMPQSAGVTDEQIDAAAAPWLAPDDQANASDVRQIVRAVLALAPGISGWQEIASAPKDRKVIVGYFNQLGKHRTVMASYYPAETLESEHTDSGWADEGWYEECESQSETIMPTDCEPTHWMPLPAAPGIAHQPQPEEPMAWSAMTNETLAKKVGAWEDENGNVCFGSWQALAAFRHHATIGIAKEADARQSLINLVLGLVDAPKGANVVQAVAAALSDQPQPEGKPWDMKTAHEKAPELIAQLDEESERLTRYGGSGDALLNEAARVIEALTQPQPEPASKGVTHQWRKKGTGPWWDGYPDHSDGDGPYETRTLYANPNEPVEVSKLAVYYYWTPKPETGWPTNLATWSQNPGPHKDWDVVAYVTLESANAAISSQQRETQEAAELKHGTPHSLGGFRGAFIGEHGRTPTEQEIWNGAIASWRDLNPAPQEAAEVTEFNVGRYCLSEDDCIAEGLHFGAYERGVEDAAKAFGRNRRG